MCPALGSFSHPILAISHILGFEFILPLKSLNVVDALLLQEVAFTNSKMLVQITEPRVYPIRMASFLSGLNSLLWLFSKQPRTGNEVGRKTCSGISGISPLPRENERMPTYEEERNLLRLSAYLRGRKLGRKRGEAAVGRYRGLQTGVMYR